MHTDFTKLNETLQQMADEDPRISIAPPRMPTQLEREASERYNAMNRHQRRAFDARAKKMMAAKKCR